MSTESTRAPSYTGCRPGTKAPTARRAICRLGPKHVSLRDILTQIRCRTYSGIALFRLLGVPRRVTPSPDAAKVYGAPTPALPVSGSGLAKALTASPQSQGRAGFSAAGRPGPRRPARHDSAPKASGQDRHWLHWATLGNSLGRPPALTGTAAPIDLSQRLLTFHEMRSGSAGHGVQQAGWTLVGQWVLRPVTRSKIR